MRAAFETAMVVFAPSLLLAVAMVAADWYISYTSPEAQRRRRRARRRRARRKAARRRGW